MVRREITSSPYADILGPVENIGTAHPILQRSGNARGVVGSLWFMGIRKDMLANGAGETPCSNLRTKLAYGSRVWNPASEQQYSGQVAVIERAVTWGFGLTNQSSRRPLKLGG